MKLPEFPIGFTNPVNIAFNVLIHDFLLFITQSYEKQIKSLVGNASLNGIMRYSLPLKLKIKPKFTFKGSYSNIDLLHSTANPI